MSLLLVRFLISLLTEILGSLPPDRYENATLIKYAVTHICKLKLLDAHVYNIDCPRRDPVQHCLFARILHAIV